MEDCSICNSDYKKAFKSDHLKSVKHLEKLNQYYCKKCNKFMPPSDKLIIQILTNTRTKLNSSKFGVKLVVITLVIKQDISKVKSTR